MGLRRRFLGRRWAALVATAAAVVSVGSASTSSADAPNATASSVGSPGMFNAAALVPATVTTAKGHRTSTTTLGGLSVTLTVKPWRVNQGTAVQFNLSVSDTHAKGAPGYLLVFGDGSSAAPALPMYCLAGPGRSSHESWQLSHRYVKAGHYKVTASGFANCGSGRVTATLNIEVV